MDFFLYVLLPGAVFFVIVWSLIRLLPDDTFFINDFSGIPPLDKEYEKELYFQKKRREQRGDGPALPAKSESPPNDSTPVH